SRKSLDFLRTQGLVTLARQEAGARTAPPIIEMAQAASADVASLKRAPRQAEILTWLLARGGPVPVEELLAAFPKARPQLRALVARKLALLSREPAGPARLADAPWGSQEHKPTGAQSSALRESTRAQGFSPFLLHGVTGS